jgi:hypothetical protein
MSPSCRMMADSRVLSKRPGACTEDLHRDGAQRVTVAVVMWKTPELRRKESAKIARPRLGAPFLKPGRGAAGLRTRLAARVLEASVSSRAEVDQVAGLQPECHEGSP